MIDKIVCPHCQGAGTVNAMNSGFIGVFKLFTNIKCSGCNGRGYVVVAAKSK